MKRGLLLMALLFAAGLLFGGCGDSGSTDTVWLPSTGQAVLRGTVSSEGGLLMADVPVTLLRSGVVVSATRTDEEGKFVFYSLEKGSYILEASAEGYALYSAELKVEGSMDWAVVLELPEPEFYTVQGNVGVTEDFPLSGLTVRLSQEMPQARAGEEDVFSSETDIDGNYEIEDVPAGQWYVEILSGEDVIVAYEELIDVALDKELNLELEDEITIVYGTVMIDDEIEEGVNVCLRHEDQVIYSTMSDVKGHYYFLNVVHNDVPNPYNLYYKYGVISGNYVNIYITETIQYDITHSTTP